MQNDAVFHAVLAAASSGDVATLAQLVQRPGYDVNSLLDGTGSTALSAAAQGGHTQCVRGLLQQGAKVNAADHEGSTALALAALGGYAEVVWLLCEAHANPNTRERTHTTPLHWAGYHGSADCVRSLLFAHADPNATDEDGTAAMTATAKGHAECALLCECAAHARTGGVLPRITVRVANQTSAPARLCFVSPTDPREQELEVLAASTSKLGAATVGDELRLYVPGGALLASHLVAQSPDPQQFVCTPPTLVPAAAVAVIWEWEDHHVGSGQWRVYPPAIAAQLAQAQAAGQSRLVLPMGTRSPPDTYTIDLAARMQRNQRTGFCRSLRHQPPGGGGGASVLTVGMGALTGPPACRRPVRHFRVLSSMTGTASSPSSPGSSAAAHAQHAPMPQSPPPLPPPPPPPPPPLPLASSLVIPGAADAQLLGSFPGAYERPPPYWGIGRPCEGESGGVGSVLRELSPDLPVYQEVLSRIATSGQDLTGLHVRAIYLSENEARFDMYAVARSAIARRSGASSVNERWLWHGTEKRKITSILANGFLRDFNERGAYGKGVYFAKQASYSLQSTYAKPEDGSGDQWLLLVRVLVGDACVGKSHMERPAQKPGAVELYDSMVDNTSDPKIVVASAGSDNRAYPEFVLCVQRR